MFTTSSKLCYDYLVPWYRRQNFIKPSFIRKYEYIIYHAHMYMVKYQGIAHR